MKLLHHPSLRLIACAITAALTLGAGAPQAAAKTFTVKNLNDSGGQSLRSALTKLANSNDDSNTVTFQAGLNGIINLNSPLPEITKSVSINGPSAEKIKLIGRNGGVFNVVAGIVSISGLTIEGRGTDSSAIVRNQFALLTISETLITGKSPSNQNGLINEAGGTTVVNSSAILRHVCAINGGAVLNQGTLSLINSTFARNSAAEGGAIYNDSDATLSMVNCTVADNSASVSGGGISNLGTISIGNTLVARNLDSANGASDVDGIFSSQGDNLIGATGNSTGWTMSDILNPTATLNLAATVADNGGPTPTLALLAGSPAIDAGNSALALDENAEALPFDQRGAPFVRIAGASVDIGAYESNTPAPLENARAYKQRALMTISASLNSGECDSLNRYYLRWAANRVSASLEPWLWLDGDRLSRYGFFAFLREQQAVWYLKKVTGPCAAAAQIAMNDLVYADEKIAAASLTAAMGAPGSDLTKAEDAYNKGLAAAAAGDEFTAISWFSWTWWYSQKALNRACDYDDDNEDYVYHDRD